MSRMQPWRRMGWLALGFTGFLFWWMAFFYAPREQVMGDVQRIFYIHLPLAWMGLLALLVSAVCHIMYYVNRTSRWLAWGWANAWIGTLFSLLVILTGMCWAKPIWGAWWPWEPRLTTTFLLFIMYLAYLVLFESVFAEGRFQVIAIYNILCAVNIPVVYMAPRLWRGLHPIVIEKGVVHLDPAMWYTVLVGLAWCALLYEVLTRSAALLIRSRLALSKHLWDI